MGTTWSKRSDVPDLVGSEPDVLYLCKHCRKHHMYPHRWFEAESENFVVLNKDIWYESEKERIIIYFNYDVNSRINRCRF